ncbi:MAG TPA: transglutaminase domain-containing protein, partial [Jatrophihabitans sp.]|nr:transglutaminase domain-containing protein [Jatrophihabitans sp.]
VSAAPTGRQSSTHPRPSPTPTPTPTSTATQTAHTGGTTFADVLASIRAERSATPEQFATLMALIARKLNVPAIVMAGFRVPLPTGATLLPEGTYTVTTAQAWTWVEVPVRGLGWVVLDPSPNTYAGNRPTQNGPPLTTPTPSPTPSQNAQLTHSNTGGHAVAPPSKTSPSTELSAGALAVIALAGLVSLLLVVLALLLVRKAVRARRRRHIADPRRRLVGAWQESVDMLVEAGLPDLTYATTAEIVGSTEKHFGPDPAAHVRTLGEAANMAIFNPAADIEPDEADAAWRAQVQLSRAVRRRLDWRARIGARLRYNRPRRVHTVNAPTSWTAQARARRATGPPHRHRLAQRHRFSRHRGGSAR